MSAPSRGGLQALPLVQYIDYVISQKGLPYQEPAKPTIRSHLSSLVQEFPCLRVQLEAFQRSDGRPSSLLLQVSGTIPILFLQVFYNIPIVIWLAEQYPFCAPLVFVIPSPFMIIKTAHPLVDGSGLVSSTHLRSWVYPTSNLVDLVRSLCSAFGQDPPLYSLNRPPHAADGNYTSMASPAPSSSLSANSTPVLSTSASSVLGPGSLLQPPPPLVNSMRVPRAHSASPPLSSTSVLGPGSLSQRGSSHGHAVPPMMQTLSAETRPLLQQNLSDAHGDSVAYHQPLARPSSALAGSLPILPSAHQYPANHHDAGAHVAQSLPSTSTTASLLGPGKISQWSAHEGRHTVHPQAAPQSSVLSKRPSKLAEGQWLAKGSLAHEGSSLHSMSSATSLLGPGKSCKLFPSYDSRNSQIYLPSPLPASQYGHVMSHLPTAASSSSPSLLGNGPLSQFHLSHAHMGVPMAQALPTSVPGPITSSSAVSRVQSQQHFVVSEGEFLNTAGSFESHVQRARGNHPLSVSSFMNPVSTSAQQSVQSPSTFTNPLLGTTGHTPDKRQDLMNTLIGCLQRDLGEYRMVKEKDMLNLMDMEGLLKHRQGLCKKGVEELELQKENLEVQLQNILINTDFLETWLLANDKSNVEIDIDDSFKPCDVLSYQLLECTSLDLAIEDELYCLDQAAQKGIVPVDSYLRLVRTLSREQFFQRALAVKIRVAQGQC
ncbi:hypothetical protein GOP47_0004477 [Adiantum capillus-veneris]|uniref:Uncharacterized protein n=1 Tax=Adiantum capillus-veneris TaxID=13818 RepID=A0A9D4ZMV6_ADICA|nr:hypothetical protein GOP47_0004477 [Adiantum capillus-veneris]